MTLTAFFRSIVLPAICLTACVLLHAGEPTIQVLVWDEQQPDQKQAYGDKFLGETIAAQLGKLPGIKVTNAHLDGADQGLVEATLNAADVLIWWGHRRHGEVKDEAVERIVSRVKSGQLALVALHSAHWSKPFVRLMQERAKADALKLIPEGERNSVKFQLTNENPQGRIPSRDALLTPSLTHTDGVWKLALPICVFPVVRNQGEVSHLTTDLPNHPIAAGLPAKWNIPHTEVYGGPFHVPKPDAIVFQERWDDGEQFTSGCVWKVGKGQVFYFRPGHETYPVFQQAEPIQVVENAVRWLGREIRTSKSGH